jgi:hypothetical protein
LIACSPSGCRGRRRGKAGCLPMYCLPMYTTEARKDFGRQARDKPLLNHISSCDEKQENAQNREIEWKWPAGRRWDGSPSNLHDHSQGRCGAEMRTTLSWSNAYVKRRHCVSPGAKRLMRVLSQFDTDSRWPRPNRFVAFSSGEIRLQPDSKKRQPRVQSRAQVISSIYYFTTQVSRNWV